MQTYFVRFHADTLAKIGTWAQLKRGELPFHPIEWKGANPTSAVVYDLTLAENGWNLPVGLGLDFRVSAASLDEALQKAHNAAEMVLSLTSLTILTQSAPPLFVLAYDATPGLSRRELVSEVRVGHRVGSRLIDPDAFQVLLTALDNLQCKAPSREQALEKLQTIARSIDWLRKGLGSENFVDEFAAYWIGLEAVDPLLVEPTRIFRTCVKCGRVIDHCNSCGEEIPASERVVNPLEGMRGVLEKQGVSKSDFKTVRSLRGALVHGSKRLQPAEVSLLRRLLPEFRSGLVRAICNCIEVSEETTAKILERPLRRSTIPFICRRQELVEMTSVPSLQDIEMQPRVSISAYSRNSSLLAEDMVQTSLTVTVKHENCRPVSDAPVTVTIRADEHSGMIDPALSMGGATVDKTTAEPPPADNHK